MNSIDATVVPAHNLSDPASLTLDLDHPEHKKVLALVESFELAAKNYVPAGVLPVHTGWNTITPTISIELLMRNRPGANRRIDPGTVYYYAGQMAAGEWKATGQPIITDRDGRLQDAQHRLYGSVISGATFPSYVVTDVEPIENLFAYIDNARPRTAATALQTAGFNGNSNLIVKVLKIAEEVRNGVYNPFSGLAKLPRMAPVQTLKLMANYPNAVKASRSTLSDWEEAVELIGGRKSIVAYLGMHIIDVHDEDAADLFFDNLTAADSEDDSPTDPFVAMRKLAARDARAEKGMKAHDMLAALIKTFNADYTGVPLGRRWTQLVDEDFPTLVNPAPQQIAAE